MLRKISLTAMFVTLMVSQALADDVDRGVEAALGGAAGGLIFGPIGLVAGAITGYTAGPAISHSWGLDRNQSRGSRKRSQRKSSNQ